MAERTPEVQLISNVVAVRSDGKVLLVRYDPEDERWWLPGEDLEPYEHPDERASKELARFGLIPDDLRMVHVESFRGRRGWHVIFHYRAEVSGEVASDYQTEWFAYESLPRTMHGQWERDAVARVLGSPVDQRPPDVAHSSK